MSRSIDYRIEAHYNGKKVINYLRGEAHYSVRLVTKMKRVPDGILLNGTHARTIDRLHTGDILTVNLPDDRFPAVCSDAFAQVVYEDEDVLVLNKPPFMPVHPTRNHQGDTLANAAASYLAQEGKAAAFRPINRLDRDTSGLVISGLNTYAASRLTHHVEKEYVAIVCGKLNGNGTIDAPIRRMNDRYIFREVGEGGDRAVTHWQTIAANDELSVLRIRLETGRTHQIRVHFSHLGMPLIGDTMYGTADERINRQALHCQKLIFHQPVTGEKIELSSDLPQDMQELFLTISGKEYD